MIASAYHQNSMETSEQPSSRFHRWVSASHRLARYEPFMVPTVQGLGRLDDLLAAKDARYVADEGYLSENYGILDLSDHITLSYLWVLGAYEIVRVLHQRERGSDSPLAISINVLLRQFARLRMPLAKFEPAERHEKTDSHIAYPVLNSAHGIAWQVSEDTYISREELAVQFLRLLESGA
jgi:hypothetical protein